MEMERYEFGIIQQDQYGFFSEGPRGRIQKVAYFHKVSASGIYNLMLGDWDEKEGRVDNHVVSDNKDRQKVLATVAAIVLTFMEEHLYAIVFATGNTPARIRLYRMGITSSIAQITIRFEIRGYINNKWELFQKGRNYSSFFIQWKKFNFKP